jgi:hypothetical protein
MFSPFSHRKTVRSDASKASATCSIVTPRALRSARMFTKGVLMHKGYFAALALAVGLAHAQELDGTHPLSIATTNAVKACDSLGAPSLEACAYNVTNSPQRSTARKAVAAAMNERAVFMSACKDGLQRCTWRVDALMQVGMNRAFQ